METRQTTAHFSTSSQMISGPEMFLDVCLSLCMVESYLTLTQIVLTDNGFPSQCSKIHYRMMPIVNAALPEGTKVTTIQWGFMALPLIGAEISSHFRDCRW